MVIYLQLKPYVAQWCVHECGDPITGAVRFPKGSAENGILEMFLSLPPRGKSPDLPGNGRIAIDVPSFRAKPAPHYWYLGKKAKDLLRSTIDTRMKLQFWQDMHRFENLDVELSSLIYSWMEKNGISNDDDRAFECLRQHYYRLRKRYHETCVKNELKRTENK